MTRKIFFVMMGALNLLQAQAQPFGNEWIHYNQTYLKLKVVKEGLYRIHFFTLENSGIPVSTIPGNEFQLFCMGKEIPVYVSESGMLSANDYIEFYDKRNDGSFDSSLFLQKKYQGNSHLSLFNDTAYYFLTWNSDTPHLHIHDYANNLQNAPLPEPYCFSLISTLFGQLRQPGFYSLGPDLYPGEGIYDSDFGPTEGYHGTVFTNSAATFNIATPHRFTGGPPASLQAAIVGLSSVNHHIDVSLNNMNVASTDFSNYIVQNFSINNISPALSSSTTITFSSAASGSADDADAPSWFDFTYARTFDFDQANFAVFTVPAKDLNQQIAVHDLNTLGKNAELLDLNNLVREVATPKNDSLRFVLPPANNDRKIILAALDTQIVIHKIDSLFAVHFTDYSLSQNQGDFIIITHPYFFHDSTGHNYVQDYATFKNQNGFHSQIVSVLDLYDEFAYGIRFHPLAIRNFADYILNKWLPASRTFFLVGKGIEFFNQNATPSLQTLNYVPTFGFPGSDYLLTATNANPTPRISIGRLPCLNPAEIGIYLSKAEEFTAAQNNPIQNIAAKAWMKNVFHLAGGENIAQQNTFQYYLNNYKSIIEDTLFGGKVYSFYKSSPDPVQYVTNTFYDSLIMSGISLITFFGHSSNNSFDFNLDKPEDYKNQGKYPLVLTNGCLIGNLFLSYHTIAEDFVFQPEKGAIAFLGPSQFSISSSLDKLSTNFYQNLSYKNYNRSMGQVIAGTIASEFAQPITGYDKASLEQMLFCGDPSFKLNTFAKPDYDIEPSSVHFIPSTISAGLDSFDLELIITNIGKAIHDSMYVDVHRIFPDGGNEFLYHKKISAPYFIDTIKFNISTESIHALGLNSFTIKVDAGSNGSVNGDIDELDENNNQLVIPLPILADDLVPAYPYDLSIINDGGVILKASTVNPFASLKQYVLQIDTTTNFNSAMLRTIRITQKGGVVHWQPNEIFIDGKVYYWRTSLDSIYKNNLVWHQFSFLYSRSETPGWNESHFFQFKQNNYTNIEIADNRQFSFVPDKKTIGAYNGITSYIGGPLAIDDPSYYINGVRIARWDCGGLGTSILFAVIDGKTGIQWSNPNLGGNLGLYNSIQCKPNPRQMFLYNTQSPYNADVVHFLDTIPTGDYLLTMSMNDAKFYLWNSDMKAAFQKLGLSKFATISSALPYVSFLKKNDATYPIYEVVGDTFTSVIDTSFAINGNWDEGYFQSPQIGPASQWNSLHWKTHDLEAGSDQYFLQVIGADANGVQTMLAKHVLSSDTDLSGISTKNFPYLILQLNCSDTLHRTPVQLDYWRVNYQPVPEVALNPNAFYQLKGDSVQQSLPVELQLAVENLSPWKTDSLLMKHTITDAFNQQHIFLKREKPVAPFDTIHSSFNLLTNCLCYGGADFWLVEANPNNDQEEQYHFNNTGLLSFFTSKDKQNPLLDVTFDGAHILDNDIVSAKPDIEILLKDENKYLALNSPSLLNISFIYPDGSKHPVVFDNVTATFIPADSNHLTGNNNDARASIKANFPVDGTYQLIVQGEDRSGNISGDNPYKISFRVINKAMISTILNYPNPFSTATRFVFTLTGSEIPDQLKIQVYTVSGKVVKEIFIGDLGNIHIGSNITDYAWNGTDQYGNKLANGLYFYKVTAFLNGKALDHFSTSADSYFEHGLGKMYLMR